MLQEKKKVKFGLAGQWESDMAFYYSRLSCNLRIGNWLPRCFDCTFPRTYSMITNSCVATCNQIQCRIVRTKEKRKRKYKKKSKINSFRNLRAEAYSIHAPRFSKWRWLKQINNIRPRRKKEKKIQKIKKIMTYHCESDSPRESCSIFGL